MLVSVKTLAKWARQGRIRAERLLIDSYLEVKRRALKLIMAHVSYSSRGKARLVT